MLKQPMNYEKKSIMGQLDSIASQMNAVFDVSMDLDIACSWYHDDDPKYGGPPSEDQLKAMSMILKSAYMNMALVTGLDPCEQMELTKERLRKARESRETLDKACHIDFDD